MAASTLDGEPNRKSAGRQVPCSEVSGIDLTVSQVAKLRTLACVLTMNVDDGEHEFSMHPTHTVLRSWLRTSVPDVLATAVEVGGSSVTILFATQKQHDDFVAHVGSMSTWRGFPCKCTTTVPRIRDLAALMVNGMRFRPSMVSLMVELFSPVDLESASPVEQPSFWESVKQRIGWSAPPKPKNPVERYANLPGAKIRSVVSYAEPDPDASDDADDDEDSDFMEGLEEIRPILETLDDETSPSPTAPSQPLEVEVTTVVPVVSKTQSLGCQTTAHGTEDAIVPIPESTVKKSVYHHVDTPWASAPGEECESDEDFDSDEEVPISRRKSREFGIRDRKSAPSRKTKTSSRQRSTEPLCDDNEEEFREEAKLMETEELIKAATNIHDVLVSRLQSEDRQKTREKTVMFDNSVKRNLTYGSTGDEKLFVPHHDDAAGGKEDAWDASPSFTPHGHSTKINHGAAAGTSSPALSIGTKPDRKLKTKPPKLTPFSGTTPLPDGEEDFESLEFNIKLRKDGYSQEAMVEGLINALRPPALWTVRGMEQEASITKMMDRLRTAYGPVVDYDSARAKFFSVRQDKEEDVNTYMVKVESLLQRWVAMDDVYVIPYEKQREILKDRFFAGLRKSIQDSIRFIGEDDSKSIDQLFQAARRAEAKALAWEFVRNNAQRGRDQARAPQKSEVAADSETAAPPLKNASKKKWKNKKKKRDSSPAESVASSRSSRSSTQGNEKGSTLARAAPSRQ